MAGTETAAMENLLSSMLKTMQAQGRVQATAFAQLAKAAGLDPKIIKSAEQSLADLGNSAEEAASSTSKLGKVGSLVGGALADLVGGVVSTAGNLAKFAASTVSGNAKFSDLFGTFKDLPIIGTVAGLFGQLAKMQEETMKTYRDLSASGINFGTSLTQLRGDFLSLGLSSDEYNKVLKDNTDVFMLMGTNVTAGAKNFKNLNRELLDNHKELLRLGFSYAEISKTVTDYARVTGGLTKQQQTDYKGTAAAMAAYAQETDLLARLTGQSREALADKLKKEQEEANWQAFLSTLGPEARKKLESAIKTIGATIGEGGVQIAKARAQGISVQGEAGKLTMSLMTNTGKTVENIIDQAQDAGISSQQFIAGTAKRVGELNFRSAQEMDKVRGVMGALQLAGNPIAGQFNQINKNLTMVNDNQIRTEEQAVRFAEEEAKRQKAQSERADIQQAQQLQNEAAMQRLSEAMNKLTGPIIDQLLIPTMNWLADNMDWLTGKIVEIIPQMAKFIENIFTPEGRQKIIDDLVKELKNIMNSVAKAVTGEKDAATAVRVAKNSTVTAGIGGGSGAVIGGLLGLLTGPAAPVMVPALAALLGGAGAYGGWKLGDALTERSNTSWGATGRLFEDFGSGKNVRLHGTEGVFKPEQIANLMSGAATESARGIAEVLNNTNQDMVYYLKDIAESNRRVLEATAQLSGNLYAT
jgi:hypothetical protein